MMEKENNNQELNWYDSGNIITSLIIGVILLVIVCSQSFAASGNSSLALFGSVINHNSIYLLVLVYFIALKTREGKRYFNYLNVILIFIYFIATFTSLLTVVQSFSLNTILSFAMNFVLEVYLLHTMFRDTRVWKEFKLGNSPFNEITNEIYFYMVIVLSVFLLAVNLISTVVVSGVIISILDAVYVVLFSRYIFLYGSYLDTKKKDINNSGNFDEIKENIKNTVDEVNEKINNFVEENKIDEKIDNVKEKINDEAKELKEKINYLVEDEVVKKKVNTKDKKGKTREISKQKTSRAKKKTTTKKKGEDK